MAKKYEGRESVMEQIVSGFGKWNYVIRLSPVEPIKVKKTFERTQVFQTDASNLEPELTII